MDRLTGGVCSSKSSQHSSGAGMRRPADIAAMHNMRNDSYYMATNDSWSPAPQMTGGRAGVPINNSVLIEDDPEPNSP